MNVRHTKPDVAITTVDTEEQYITSLVKSYPRPALLNWLQCKGSLLLIMLPNHSKIDSNYQLYAFLMVFFLAMLVRCMRHAPCSNKILLQGSKGSVYSSVAWCKSIIIIWDDLHTQRLSSSRDDEQGNHSHVELRVFILSVAENNPSLN